MFGGALLTVGSGLKLRDHSLALKKSLRMNSNSVAVKLVAAGLGADADHAAQEVAELGAGIVGDYVEFLNGVHARGKRDVIVHEFVVVDAIEQIVVGLLAIAVDIGPAGVEMSQARC